MTGEQRGLIKKIMNELVFRWALREVTEDKENKFLTIFPVLWKCIYNEDIPATLTSSGGVSIQIRDE